MKGLETAETTASGPHSEDPAYRGETKVVNKIPSFGDVGILRLMSKKLSIGPQSKNNAACKSRTKPPSRLGKERSVALVGEILLRYRQRNPNIPSDKRGHGGLCLSQVPRSLLLGDWSTRTKSSVIA
jgi:hypothetical protein